LIRNGNCGPEALGEHACSLERASATDIVGNPRRIVPGEHCNVLEMGQIDARAMHLGP
jgi:hypothetical protein